MIMFFYISLGVLLAYRMLMVSALATWSDRNDRQPKGGVSLIICARNEAQNLERYLPLWVKQTHPVKEIVVVDDGSTDGTAEILNHFPGIKGVRIDPEDKAQAGKKQALELGIAVAQHEVIAVTDADCRPASEHSLWLLHTALKEGDELVLSYAPMERKRTLSGLFQRYETWITALQSMGMAVLGHPYMGTGRNMLYRRTLFSKTKIKGAYRSGIGGDDDLLVNRADARPKAAICLNPDAYVYSDVEEGISAYFRKKRRHISASRQYRGMDQIWLVILGVIPIAVLVLAFVLIAKGTSIPLMMGLGIYFIIQWPLCSILMWRMKERDLIPVFPFLELAYWCYLIIMAPVSLYKSPKKW